MTKSELVSKISSRTGIDRADVNVALDGMLAEIKLALESGNNVYMRGFGSFIVKKRAEKTARNISKGTIVKVPAHNIPAFKPAEVFLDAVRTKVKIKN